MICRIEMDMPTPHGSWKDILVVQPPLAEIEVYRDMERVGSLAAQTGRPGITCGLIDEHVEQMMLSQGFRSARVWMRGGKEISVVFWP